MTRTERSAFPRAVLKDRSESRSGLNKALRKNGGGQHNWGSIADEGALEYAAIADEEQEFAEDVSIQELVLEDSDGEKPVLQRRASTVTEEDVETARKFRKNAFKGQGIDLSAIARTSYAVSTSPTAKTPPISLSIANITDTSSISSGSV